MNVKNFRAYNLQKCVCVEVYSRYQEMTEPASLCWESELC